MALNHFVNDNHANLIAKQLTLVFQSGIVFNISMERAKRVTCDRLCRSKTVFRKG